MEPVRRKKRIMSAEAETELPDISEQIVVAHILPKLPVKTLLQFKCVSKYWCSLISDPKFKFSTQRHQVIVMSIPTRESKTQKSASVHLIDDKAAGKELSMPDPLRGALAMDGPDLRGSCNGLVLVSYDFNLFLWNPLTRWCKKVLSHWRFGNFMRALARSFVSGLCYDSFTDDYKAVIACEASDIVMVGSFKNRTWTQIHFPHSKKNMMSGPTVNDRVHCLVRTREDQRPQVMPYLIVSFDPQMNEFVEVPVPQNERIKGAVVHGFGVLGGCLSLALSTKFRYMLTEFEVFAMKKYGDEASWTSLFIISDSIVFDPFCNLTVPLCSSEKGEVLFQRAGGLMAYDPEHNSSTVVQILSDGGHIYCGNSFLGSLVSPTNYNLETEDYTEISLSGTTRKYNKKGLCVDLSK